MRQGMRKCLSSPQSQGSHLHLPSSQTSSQLVFSVLRVWRDHFRCPTADAIDHCSSAVVKMEDTSPKSAVEEDGQPNQKKTQALITTDQYRGMRSTDHFQSEWSTEIRSQL